VSTSLTRSIARLILLPTLVTAAAVLVKGYAETGDGFSAGIIAAVGLMLQYMVFARREVEQVCPRRYGSMAAFLGLLLLLLAAFVPVLRGDAILTHLPRPGEEAHHLGGLELNTAVLFDLGVFLVVVGFALSTTSLLAEVGERRPG
jgi:multisubunit Na+/H+ antiporter MnhB subunit